MRRVTYGELENFWEITEIYFFDTKQERDNRHFKDRICRANEYGHTFYLTKTSKTDNEGNKKYLIVIWRPKINGRDL